jgi:hypothetical protein
MRNLISWFISTFILGLFPFIVNLFTQYLTNNLGFLTVFNVKDIACFVVIVSSTTLLEIRTKEKSNSLQICIGTIMIMQLAFSAILAGVDSYIKIYHPPGNNYDQIANKLALSSIVIAVISAISVLLYRIVFSARHNGAENVIDKATI